MFILKGKFIHYTKEVIKPLQIILLSIIFLTLIIFIKYKPVYSVTLSGEALGYVTEKAELENKISEYINTEEENIASIDIEVMPEYKLELTSRSEETEEEEILKEIEETAVITYITYGITVNGEIELEVNSETEALEIIEDLTTDLEEEVDFDVAYTSVYKTNLESTSKEEALTTLTELKIAKVTEYEEEQARIAEEEAEAAAAEAAKLAAETTTTSSSSYTSVSSSSYGSINGITVTTPLKGSALITSRYGEVSSSRSSTHTGLDLATSVGTAIYPIASGTVTSASYQGSYGNLIIINHGNGVESYYAHCSSINVSVGDTVDTDTIIGTVGSTGNSTGPHLHLEIRINGSPVNPQNYLY